MRALIKSGNAKKLQTHKRGLEAVVWCSSARFAQQFEPLASTLQKQKCSERKSWLPAYEDGQMSFDQTAYERVQTKADPSARCACW